MPNTLNPRRTASAETFHESTHMRSVTNTTETGAKVVEVRISALSMRWHGQTLQVVHKLTASPGRRPPDRTAGRNMRSRR